MSEANAERRRQWRKDVDAALLREEEKILEAARAAVVEAAKAWEMADFGRDQEEADALADAVANLKKLERPDAEPPPRGPAGGAGVRRGGIRPLRPEPHGGDDAMTRQEGSTFEQDLTVILNSHSVEGQSDTPDWLLAQYLMSCLEAWNKATLQRDNFYARTGQLK